MKLDLTNLSLAFRQFQLVYVAFRLGIPGLLASGPKTIEELATATSVPVARLIRLLRGLVWVGIVTHGAEGVELSEEAQSLRGASPDAIADEFLFMEQFYYSSWGHLYDYLTTGANPFAQAHGRALFDLVAASPELAVSFNNAMTFSVRKYAAAIAALPPFAHCQTAIDIGGGAGQLLLDLLAARAEMKGVVFDLHATQAAATQLIRQYAMEERCQFVAGDMFTGVPAGGGVYLLARILHDWDDDKVKQLLRQVRAQMNTHARLIAIERVMPMEVTAQAGPLILADLNMLCVNEGAVRTEQEFAALFEQAGLTLQEAILLEQASGYHALIGKPISKSKRAFEK